MTVCFVHIPKTAGTSVRESLVRQLGEEAVYWIGHRRPPEEWLDAGVSQFSGFALVGGHAPVEEFRNKVKNVTLIAALIRDPIARAVSLFDFIVNHPERSHPLMNELKEMGLERAVIKSERFIAEISDRQCIMLGSIRYSDILDQIKDGVMVVETVESARDCLKAVTDALGIKKRTKLMRVNVGRSGYKRDVVSDCVRKAIVDMNPNDTKLYAALLKQRGFLRFPWH